MLNKRYWLNKNNKKYVKLLNIEQFYEVIKLKKLKKEYFNFKIYQANKDLSYALLKMNDSLIFRNLTNDSIFPNGCQIKNKMFLLECHLNPKESHFVTNIAVRRD